MVSPFTSRSLNSVRTDTAGPTFSELPGGCRGVSANAATTKPTRLLAAFVVRSNETDLTIPFGNLQGTDLPF